MPERSKSNKKQLSMPIIGAAVGTILFIAAYFSFDLTGFISQLPNDGFGFCAVGAIVFLGVYGIGGMIVFALAKKQKEQSEKK